MTPITDTPFAVPLTIKEPEKVSLVIEALSSAGYHHITPAYFDSALSVKYARDAESSDMLKIISDTLCMDLAFLNSFNRGKIGRALQYCLSNPNTGVASYLESISEVEKQYIKEINDFYQSK